MAGVVVEANMIPTIKRHPDKHINRPGDGEVKTAEGGE